MPPANQPGIKLVTFQDYKTPIMAVRQAVFIDELGIDPELEWDERDSEAVYAIAHLAKQVVGVGRLLPDGQLGRLAVLPDWRQQGIGRRLVQHLLEAAADRGMNKICLSAQLSSLPFYEKMGFKQSGDQFLAAGIPHQAMQLSLTSTAMNQP